MTIPSGGEKKNSNAMPEQPVSSGGPEQQVPNYQSALEIIAREWPAYARSLGYTPQAQRGPPPQPGQPQAQA